MSFVCRGGSLRAGLFQELARIDGVETARVASQVLLEQFPGGILVAEPVLEERVGDHAFLVAISADGTLTERQRKVLLEIYAAFQTENAAAVRAAAETQEELP